MASHIAKRLWPEWETYAAKDAALMRTDRELFKATLRDLNNIRRGRLSSVFGDPDPPEAS